MPKSELHQKKKRKNITLFLILLGLIGLVYAITIMKMSAGASH